MEILINNKKSLTLKDLFWGTVFLIIVISSIPGVDSLRTKGKPRVTNVTTTSKPKPPSDNEDPNPISSKVLQIKNPPKIRKNQISEIKLPINSDIIVGDDVPSSSKIILQCSASFPLQWIYTGDGFPEISTNTTFKNSKKSGKGKQQEEGIFLATATLGLKGKLRETDTGEYICKGVQQRDHLDSVSYFIYVPGKSIFTQKKGHDLRIHKGKKHLRIPCSVTDPKTVVTIQRSDGKGGLRNCQGSEDEIKFNPKYGFDVNLNTAEGRGNDEIGNGSYICIAKLNGVTKMLEFPLSMSMSNAAAGDALLIEREEEDETIDVSVPAIPAGDNDSIMEIEDHKNNNNQLRMGQTQGSASCFPSNPCGPNSRCSSIRGSNLPRCECLPLYLGKPPKCRPECVLNLDCPRTLSCRNYQCEDPCENNCGVGAKCRVVNHQAVCSCPAGYFGNPMKGGKCGRTRSPSQYYFPNYPPQVQVQPKHHQQQEGDEDYSNSEESSSETELEGSEEQEHQQYELLFQLQNRFPCSPWPCGPNSECKPVGDNAHCTCAPNYAGQPPNCRRPECRRNDDCREEHSCIDSLCQNPCQLGKRKCNSPAKCVVANHSAKCVIMGGGSQNSQSQGQNRPNRPPQIIGQFPESPSQESQSQVQYPQNPNYPNPTPPPQQISISGMRPGYPNNRPTMTPPGSGSSGMFGQGQGQGQRPPYEPSGSGSSPCTNSPCGKYAICSFRNSTIGCKCPSGMSGMGSDPYVECFPSNNPCEVCGPNSECFVKKNRPPVCNCLPGKIGSPPNCRDNYCQRSSECRDDQHCFNNQCENPCRRATCGENAICRPMRHHAVCACVNAPDRDPLFGCDAILEDY